MFGQDFTCPALLEDTKRFLPVRGCHPLWPDFPDGSGSYLTATGLVRVRSPLLTESRLMSFPPGTEMFQFPGFASAAYGFSGGYLLAEWVAPFGDPRIKACSRLPKAFRSVPRPSSPLGAKASTRCPCFPRPPPATTTAPHAICDRARPRQSAHRADETRSKRSGAAAGSNSSDNYHKAWLPARRPRRHGAKHTHARMRALPADGKTKRRAGTRDLPMPVARTNAQAHGSLHGHARATGTSSPPHDVQTTSSQPRASTRARRRGKRGSLPGRPGHGPGPRWPPLPQPGQRGLVGLGRLERPTSRLSGVRSNQLSYRPESHPDAPAAGTHQTGRTRLRPGRRLLTKGRADGGGP